jgi:beta-xylosidase
MMEDAKMPKMMLAGFGGIPYEEPFITAAENKKNTQVVIDDWMLGPEKPSNERGANKPYWMALAKAMQVDEAEARRRRCSNCEYYDNSVMTQVKMDKISWNQWDVGAGFRGYCNKFDFICHDLRSCQAWEEREFEED